MGPAIVILIVVVLGVMETANERRRAENQGMKYIDRDDSGERWARPNGKASVSFPVDPRVGETILVFGALVLWSAVPWVISRAAARWIAARREAVPVAADASSE